MKLNGRMVNLRLSEKGERICELWRKQDDKELTNAEADELRKLEAELAGGKLQ